MRGEGTVLIVGGKLKVVRKAKALGLDVLYLQKKQMYSSEHSQYVDKAVLVDFEDQCASIVLAGALYEIAPFRSVISLTEPGLLTAARINDSLQLSGTSYATTQLLRDKSAMRRHLNAKGFSRVQASEGRTRADLEAFVDAHGLPVIVKPVEGTASLGVMCLDSRVELDEAWRSLASSHRGRFVVEEYLEGPEVSVESFSFDGDHVILAITDKLCTPSFVEIGHTIPATLPPSTEDEVADCVSRFLDLVGLRDGPAHTEVKLTARGPRIVEGHNRVGGDKINELVEIACGLDMDTMALGWPFRLVKPPARPVRLEKAVAIRFFTPDPGTIEAVAGVERARAAEGVVEVHVSVLPGTRVRSLGSSFDRVGYTIAEGPTAQLAAARCERARDLVQFLVRRDC